MTSGLLETLHNRIEQRTDQLQRVARQRHGLAITRDQAAAILTAIVSRSALRMADLLGSDQCDDAAISLAIHLTRAKAPELFGDKAHAS